MSLNLTGYTSPIVHSHYGTEPVTEWSAQHLQRTAEPVDQESALIYIFHHLSKFLFTDVYNFHIQHLQCTAEPVDQQSALHTYFSSFK